MVNQDEALIRARDARDARAVATAMAIPAHVVQAKGHGHAGTAMAMAPLAHVLYSRLLRHDPAQPEWPGRDRVVLSAGHASLLLYVQLHLTGYGLELDELALSRTLGSRTPGHPERGHTPGIEMSTGPLGQGVASAVGMALASRRDEAVFGAGSGLFDHTVWAIAGDGCLQEGISSEASSLAATLGLDNLVLIWDDNRITIDGPTSDAFAEDVRARYRAYGWRVLEIHDHLDLDEIEDVLSTARERTGVPTFVAVRTTIGAPSPTKAGTAAAHAGGFGDDDVTAIKERLGFAGDAGLAELVPADVLEHCRAAGERGAGERTAWEQRFADWSARNPASAAARRKLEAGGDPAELEAALVGVEIGAEPVATRVVNGAVLRALQPSGILWGGSADLAGSTNVALPGEPVSAERPGGELLRFGVREHAMTAILSGIALHGLWRPFGSTYLVFSDYARPSIRLAALMELPAVYIYTHDSVAVGEDGPTHQPVEQIAGLRTVPGLDVVRPADARETVAVWRRLLAWPVRPTALVLSRQNLPVLEAGDASAVARGGYVLAEHGGGADLALLASGSEVHLAQEAAATLADEGVSVRVVSLPCWEWFEAEDETYRDAVLPPGLRARVAVEAGRGDAWYRWVGLDGAIVSVEEFGESGSGPEVMARRGVTVDAVLAAARSVLQRGNR